MVIDPGNNSVNKNGSPAQGAHTSKAKGQVVPERKAVESPETTAPKDSVSLSSEAQSLARLEAALKDSPDIDHDKVERIKQALTEGRYSVDSHSIAEKMLDREVL